MGQADRQRAADEGCHRHQPAGRTGSAENNGSHRTQRSTLADTDDAGVGQRIAKQALQAPAIASDAPTIAPNRAREQLPDHGRSRLLTALGQAGPASPKAPASPPAAATATDPRRTTPALPQQRQRTPPSTSSAREGRSAGLMPSAELPGPWPAPARPHQNPRWCTSAALHPPGTRLACPTGVCFSVGCTLPQAFGTAEQPQVMLGHQDHLRCRGDHPLVAQLRVVLHPGLGADVDAAAGTISCADALSAPAVGEPPAPVADTWIGRGAWPRPCQSLQRPVELALHLRGQCLPRFGQP